MALTPIIAALAFALPGPSATVQTVPHRPPLRCVHTRRWWRQHLNHRYPAYGNHHLTTCGVRASAELAGWSPGRALQADQVSIGESRRRPGAISGDGGYGLMQNTPRVWGAAGRIILRRLGGRGAMLNPIRNMRMARWLYRNGGGWSQWYGVGYLRPYRRGVRSVFSRRCCVRRSSATT